MLFFSELKRRNVYRVGTLYVIASWLVLQVTDVTMSVLELPGWAGKVVFQLLAIGFPISLILAWLFELTPAGVVRESADTTVKSAPVKRHKIDYLILGLLLVALTWFALEHDWGERPGSAKAGEIRSLVVLPLENLMNDPAQAYFVDGMHDAIIAELSHVSELRVTSRTSANRYRQTALSLPEIARELDVDAVVEGSVLRAGDTVRINVQLIDARDEQHVWGEQFDRGLGDILLLYSDVTLRIADAVKVQLKENEEVHLAAAAPIDPNVYDRQLRAAALCDTWTPSSMLLGIDQLRDLISSAPNDARVHARLALCLQYAAYYGIVDSLEVREEAMGLADRAVRLAPDYDLAHVARGGTYWYLGFDASTAIAALERALDINPAQSRALIHHAWLMSESGFPEPARASAQKAVRLDRFNSVTLQALGQTFYLARQFEESLEAFSAAVELSPREAAFYIYPAMALTQLGRHQEALGLLRKALELSEGVAFITSEYGAALAMAGQRKDALDVLDQLMVMAKEGTASPFHLALVNMSLGNKTAALDGFEAAYEMRDIGLFNIGQDARFDSLRDEPRFAALIQSLAPADSDRKP